MTKIERFRNLPTAMKRESYCRKRKHILEASPSATFDINFITSSHSMINSKLPSPLSVTRLGNISKFLTTNFLTKRSPNIRWPFGLFKAKKLIWPLLGQLWLRFGLLLFLHLVTLGVNQFNTHSRFAWLKICSRIPLSLKVYIWEVIYLPRHRH